VCSDSGNREQLRHERDDVFMVAAFALQVADHLGECLDAVVRELPLITPRRVRERQRELSS